MFIGWSKPSFLKSLKNLTKSLKNPRIIGIYRIKNIYQNSEFSMEDQKSSQVPIHIEQEMRTSYLDYAMSVIIGRALPDVRDGLKPVHRRALYTMSELKNTWNSSYKKSARIVGDCIGKYHPHGDQAVYDTVVRMAQDFSMRYVLVDGQGNFGSVDGDPAAAMRYTEVRMSKLANELLADLDKETVEFGPTYDESSTEPLVLPTKIPNLLVNGASGIAVGMATNIPTHNLKECIDACVALLDHPEVSIRELMQYMPGPDFPTGGIIYGQQGIVDAYEKGRGSIRIRAKTKIEEDHKGQESIIVTELPYQVNKARLLEKIAELVKEKKIEGIRDLRDESDRQGMRMVIELKRDAQAKIVLNTLFKMTALETSFGINMLAIVQGEPRILNLKEILNHFLEHRRDVILRRSHYDLKKAKVKAHELEGYAIALNHVDQVIDIIKSSDSTDQAKDLLIEKLGLSDEQSKYILEMRLRRLTSMAKKEIEDDLDAIRKEIGRLEHLIADKDELKAQIRRELLEVLELSDSFKDKRKTAIEQDARHINTEDLIPVNDMVVTVTKGGYIKTTAVSEYQTQSRGGRGKASINTKNDDVVSDLFVTSTHSYMLFFTTKGRVFVDRVFNLPVGSKQSRGKPLHTIFAFEQNAEKPELSEKLATVLPIAKFEAGKSLLFVTSKGIVKKSDLMLYKNIRASRLNAIKLNEDDSLNSVHLTSGDSQLLLATHQGRFLRFSEKKIRNMGRTATGVRGIKYKFENDYLIGCLTFEPSEIDVGSVLIITEEGKGKRVMFSDFPEKLNRGSTGVTGMPTKKHPNRVAGMVKITQDTDEFLIMTDQGVVLRAKASNLNTQGRQASGVKVMRVPAGSMIVSVAYYAVAPDEEAAEGTEVFMPEGLDATAVLAIGEEDQVDEDDGDEDEDDGDDGDEGDEGDE